MKNKFTRNVVMFMFCIMTIFMVCSFAGCKEPVIPESSTEDTKDEVIAELKPIGFKISLPNKQSRAYYSQDDASSYVVELSFDGSVISTQNGTPGQTLTFTVEREGTYTINVEAYNTEKTLIAEGSASKSITFADGYVSVVVALRPKKIETTDPSNPSVTNKVDIGVDIQWVLPEEKILTLENKGNSNFRRRDSGTSLGNTVVLEFTSGMTLREIFEVNDVSFWLDSYEKNGKNYEFCSYYIDSNGNEYYEHSMLTEDITLFPEFRVVPKVTFNLNGGNIYGDVSDKVYFTNWVDKYYPYQPTKDGFSFVGWTLTPDGEDFVTNIEEDITVYAKYIEVQSCTLTVTTNENSYFYSYSEGNLGTSITLEFTSGMTLSEIFENNRIGRSPEPYTYEVDGESYSFDCYQDVNQNEYNYNSVLLEDLELIAVYVREPKITWNLNGGTVNGDTSDVVTNFLDEESPVPVKENFVIYGWTQTPDAEDYVVTSDGFIDWEFLERKYDLSEDLTLYASWKEAEICILTLQAPENVCFTSISTGESLGSYLTLEFTNGITLGEIFIANDVRFEVDSFFDADDNLYNFEWDYEYYDKINDYFIDYYENTVVINSLELTPNFSGPLPQVTFNLNGGNVDGDTSDVIANTDYFSINYNPVVQPTKEGYILIGWTLTPDGDDIVDSAKSKMTVYAKWADPLQPFESGDIIGDFAADGMLLTYEGEGIYTAEFVYSEDMNAWGSVLGVVAFKLRPTAGDWSSSYGMLTPPILNGDEGQISLSSSYNIVVGGFEVGLTYKFTVRCTETGDVFVSVSTVE